MDREMAIATMMLSPNAGARPLADARICRGGTARRGAICGVRRSMPAVSRKQEGGLASRGEVNHLQAGMVYRRWRARLSLDCARDPESVEGPLSRDSRATLVHVLGS